MGRENPFHWEVLVFLEMFVAGVAAGAYATATLLELLGQGRSPLARTAHLLAFPLMALAGLLLILDLDRPERFWHMIVMSQALVPMWKPWSPMSIGSWLIVLFPAVAFISFLDALIARRMLRIGRWTYERTLHGTPLGLLLSLVGGLLALAVGAYSGVLLSVTNIGGWSHSVVVAPLYVATALLTGMAAVLLLQALLRDADALDLRGLTRATTGVAVWWLVLVVIFLLTLGRPGLEALFQGFALQAFVGAVLLVGLFPLALGGLGNRARAAPTGLIAASILVGGLMFRMAVVMAPQLGQRIPGAG